MLDKLFDLASKILGEQPKVAKSPETPVTKAEKPKRYFLVVKNNNHNTFEEVVVEFVKLGLTPDSARMFAWEIDNFGAAKVTVDSYEVCTKQMESLKAIGLESEVVEFC